MKLQKFAPIAFAAMALLGVAAQGAVDTHTVAFNSILNAAPFAVSLPQFDPALGTLQSVQLTLAGTAIGVFTFDNESTVAGNVALTYGFATAATTNLPLATTVSAPIFNASGNGPVTVDTDVLPDFSGTDAFAISGNGSQTVSSGLLTGAFLSQYIAPVPGSNFTLDINNTVSPAIGPTTTAGIFGATRQSGGHLSGNVTVAYSYLLSPVPEAVTTIWGACVGLFALGRRKRVRVA